MNAGEGDLTVKLMANKQRLVGRVAAEVAAEIAPTDQHIQTFREIRVSLSRQRFLIASSRPTCPAQLTNQDPAAGTDVVPLPKIAGTAWLSIDVDNS